MVGIRRSLSGFTLQEACQCVFFSFTFQPLRLTTIATVNVLKAIIYSIILGTNAVWDQGALTVWLTVAGLCRWLSHHMQSPRGLYSYSLMMSSMIAPPVSPPEVSYWLLSPPCSPVIAAFLPDSDTDTGWWGNQKGAEITQSGWLDNLLCSVSHSQRYVHVKAHILSSPLTPKHTHTRTQTTSVTAVNIITVSFGPRLRRLLTDS